MRIFSGIAAAVLIGAAVQMVVHPEPRNRYLRMGDGNLMTVFPDGTYKITAPTGHAPPPKPEPRSAPPRQFDI